MTQAREAFSGIPTQSSRPCTQPHTARQTLHDSPGTPASSSHPPQAFSAGPTHAIASSTQLQLAPHALQAPPALAHSPPTPVARSPPPQLSSVAATATPKDI